MDFFRRRKMKIKESMIERKRLGFFKCSEGDIINLDSINYISNSQIWLAGSTDTFEIYDYEDLEKIIGILDLASFNRGRIIVPKGSDINQLQGGLNIVEYSGEDKPQPVNLTSEGPGVNIEGMVFSEEDLKMISTAEDQESVDQILFKLLKDKQDI